MNNRIKIALFVILIFTIQISFSQCWDVRDQSVSEIYEHYNNSDFDLLDQSLSTWASTCEMNEELFRLSILSAIQNNKPIESLLDENTIGYLRSYETQKQESLIPYYHSPSFAGYIESDKLLIFTKKWAEQLEAHDKLSQTILHLYSGGESNETWRLFFNFSFPHRPTQEAFNRIINDSGPESFLSITGGGFFHLESKTPAPQLGLSLDRYKANRYQSFGGYVRFGSKTDLELEFKNFEDKIASNSLHFFYNHGKRFKGTNANYLIFGTAANSLFISEYITPNERKKVVSVFQLGVGAGMYFANKKPNKIGIEVRYLPLNFVTNKDVNMNVSSISLNLKYMILNSRVASEFLNPIGYYNR